jgi:CBS domain containing-hemolysin-like protein
MLTQLQKIPSVGDSFEYDGRRYTVASMDGLRIDTVKIEVAQSQAQPQPAPPAPVTH